MDLMRNFRDAKAMARTLRQALAPKGLEISNSEALELVAQMLGERDWNTLAAAIAAAESEPGDAAAPKPLGDAGALDVLAQALGLDDWEALMTTVGRARRRETPPAPPAPYLGPGLPQPTERAGFSQGLQEALHRTVALAVGRKHDYYTLEHLLLALIDDKDAATVMEACDVDLTRLRDAATAYIDNELESLVVDDGEEPGPTAGVHRVIHRAVIHVQSAGRDTVTGANAMIAIYSERESHAFHFLQQTGMTRYDAVNFVAHGIRKGGRAA
jgi:hypothetical protein